MRPRYAADGEQAAGPLVGAVPLRHSAGVRGTATHGRSFAGPARARPALRVEHQRVDHRRHGAPAGAAIPQQANAAARRRLFRRCRKGTGRSRHDGVRREVGRRQGDLPKPGRPAPREGRRSPRLGPRPVQEHQGRRRTVRAGGDDRSSRGSGRGQGRHRAAAITKAADSQLLATSGRTAAGDTISPRWTASRVDLPKLAATVAASSAAHVPTGNDAASRTWGPAPPHVVDTVTELTRETGRRRPPWTKAATVAHQRAVERQRQFSSSRVQSYGLLPMEVRSSADCRARSCRLDEEARWTSSTYRHIAGSGGRGRRGNRAAGTLSMGQLVGGSSGAQHPADGGTRGSDAA